MATDRRHRARLDDGRRHGVELPLLGTPILCSSRSYFLQHEDKQQQQQHQGPDGGGGGEGPLIQMMLLFSSSTPRATQPAHQASKVHMLVLSLDRIRCLPCRATHPSMANSSHRRRRRCLQEIFPDLLCEVMPPGHGWWLRSRFHRGDGVVRPRL